VSAREWDADVVEKVAQVVDRHEYDVSITTGVPIPACECGWVAEHDWTSTYAHSVHVAEAVLDAMRVSEASS